MTTSNEILVVDDNSDIRVLISGFLRDKGLYGFTIADKVKALFF